MKKNMPYVEMLAVLALIEIQIWAVGHRSMIPALVGCALIIQRWIRNKETLAALGLVNIYALTPVCGLLAVHFFFAGKLHFLGPHPPPPLLHAIDYFGWATFQQVILNGFFAKGLLPGSGPRRASIVAGLLFSFIHLPNPILMAITLLGGIAASAVYLRMEKKNVYLLAACHVAIGLLFYYSIPASLHRNFVVGPKFFRAS